MYILDWFVQSNAIFNRGIKIHNITHITIIFPEVYKWSRYLEVRCISVKISKLRRSLLMCMVPATLTPLLVQARTRGRIRNLKLVHSGGSDLGTNLYYVVSGRCIQQLHHVDSAGGFSNWRPAIGEWLFVDTAAVIFIGKSTTRAAYLRMITPPQYMKM